LKIERLFEVLHSYMEIKVFDFFAGVEEMKTLGLNSMSLIVDLGPEVEYAFLYLRYLVSTEELIPIAMVIQLKKDRAKDLDLDQLLRLLRSYRGYLYGGLEGIGILIPVDDENLHQIFADVLPKIIETLFGYKVKPIIKSYELSFHQEVYIEEPM
jgi:hypothetical protein